MDPSLYYCLKKSSFNSKNEDYKISKYVNNSTDFKMNLNQLPVIDIAELDINLNLGKSIFKFYNSVIFANLDALCFGTKHFNGSLKFSANDPYLDNIQLSDLQNPEVKLQPNLITSIIINDDTTGVIDYIKFRKPEAICYTVNSINTKDSVKLNLNGTVDLENDWESVVSEIQKSSSLGVDLIVNYSDNSYKICLLISVFLLNNNGTFIYKLPELDTKFLYTCSLFFNEISIVRPLSDLENIYLIAKNKKIIDGKLLDFLKNVNEDFNINVPTDFIDWINDIGNKINTKIEGDIDLYKPFIIWNIPDNLRK
jgi:hypothetical protein